jgi:hypothetical protein
MKQKRFWTAAAIIACVVAFGFLVSAPHTHDVARRTATPDKIPAPTVALHDSFKKGIHTITGSLSAPDACVIVTADATISGNASSTERIQLAISMPPDVGVCLQLPTVVDFSIAIPAPAHLPISATVNGRAASTTAL